MSTNQITTVTLESIALSISKLPTRAEMDSAISTGISAAISKLPTLEDISKLPTLEDISKLPTLEDISKLPTREEISKLATRNEMSTAIETSFNELAGMVNQGFMEQKKLFTERFDSFELEVNERFNTMDGRFDTLEKKFDAVQATVYRNHENRLRKLEVKVGLA